MNYIWCLCSSCWIALPVHRLTYPCLCPKCPLYFYSPKHQAKKCPWLCSENCLEGMFLNVKISENVWSPMKSYKACKVKEKRKNHEELPETVFERGFGLNWTTPTLKMGNTCTFSQLLSLLPLLLYAGFTSSPSECPILHKQFFSKIDSAPLQLLFYGLLRTRFRSLAQRGFLPPP